MLCCSSCVGLCVTGSHTSSQGDMQSIYIYIYVYVQEGGCYACCNGTESVYRHTPCNETYRIYTIIRAFFYYQENIITLRKHNYYTELFVFNKKYTFFSQFMSKFFLSPFTKMHFLLFLWSFLFMTKNNLQAMENIFVAHCSRTERYQLH